MHLRNAGALAAAIKDEEAAALALSRASNFHFAPLQQPSAAFYIYNIMYTLVHLIYGGCALAQPDKCRFHKIYGSNCMFPYYIHVEAALGVAAFRTCTEMLIESKYSLRLVIIIIVIIMRRQHSSERRPAIVCQEMFKRA